MPEASYIAAAIAISAIITVTLRALPFGLAHAMRGSALLASLGRWMPLGALTILLIYLLAGIERSPQSLPQLAGIAATVAVHAWRRNAVLSIVAGTATCIAATALL